MEGKEWCIRQGIWEVTDYRKEDASEGKRIVHHYIHSKIGHLPFGIRNNNPKFYSYIYLNLNLHN
jgi:hypothetical protein